jgi:hypothetical protein
LADLLDSSPLKPFGQMNRNLVGRFRIIWPSGFRGEEFKKSANQKQESPVAAMFVTGSGRNEQSLQRTILVSDWLISKKSFLL